MLPKDLSTSISNNMRPNSNTENSRELKVLKLKRHSAMSWARRTRTTLHFGKQLNQESLSGPRLGEMDGPDGILSALRWSGKRWARESIFTLVESI